MVGSVFGGIVLSQTQEAEPISAPSQKIEGNAHQIIIREVQRSRAALQVGMGLLGLGLVAGGVASGYLVDGGLNPLIPLAAVVAVLGFGILTILSWRRSGEFEIVEVVDGRLRLVNSSHRGFMFDAPLEQAKVHRVRHSMGLRLCLRDGVRAVEVGNNLSPEQREVLAERIDAAVANAMHAPAQA